MRVIKLVLLLSFSSVVVAEEKPNALRFTRLLPTEAQSKLVEESRFAYQLPSAAGAVFEPEFVSPKNAEITWDAKERGLRFEGSPCKDCSGFTIAGMVTASSSTPLLQHCDKQGKHLLTLMRAWRGSFRISFQTTLGEWRVHQIPILQAHPEAPLFFAMSYKEGEDTEDSWLRVELGDRRFRISFPGKLATSEDGTLLIGGWSSMVSQFAIFERTLSTDEIAKLSGVSFEQEVALQPADFELEMFSLSGPRAAVNKLRFSRDGSRLAAVSDDAAIWIWKSPNFELESSIPVEFSTREVCFSVDDKIIAASGKAPPHLFVVETGTLVGRKSEREKMPDTLSGECQCIEFAPSGSDVFYSLGRTFHNFNFLSRKMNGTASIPSEMRGIAMSPDSKLIASTHNGAEVICWDRETLGKVHSYEGHSDKVYDVSFSSDGQLLATSSGDQTIRIWDVATTECLAILRGHNEGVKSVAFHPTEKLLISGSYDRSVRVWESQTWKQVYLIENIAANHVAVSPDGTWIAFGGDYLSRTYPNGHAESYAITLLKTHELKDQLRKGL